MSEKITEEARRKLLAHVSLCLKSFNLTVIEYRNKSCIAHLRSLYKKKEYLFYVVKDLSLKEVNSKKFQDSVEYCTFQNCHFIVVARSWDKALGEYFEDGKDFKLISFDKLTTLGREYIEAKEREAIKK